jgi:signal transduction histidine kinase
MIVTRSKASQLLVNLAANLMVNLASQFFVLVVACGGLCSAASSAQAATSDPVISTIELAATTTDMLPAADAQWQQSALPYFNSYQQAEQLPGFLWFRFSLPRLASGETLGLFTARHMLNLDVYVNGEKLYSERSQNANYLSWNMPLLVELQPGSLNLERNEIVLALRSSTGTTYLNKIYVEPYATARERYAAAYFYQVQMAFIALITSIVLGLLTFALWVTRRQHVEYLYFCSSCLSWAGVMLYMVLPYPLWPHWESWNVAAYFCINLTALAVLAFICRVLKFKARAWLIRLLWLQGLGQLAVLLLPHTLGFPLAYLLNLLSLIGFLVIGIRLARLLRTRPTTSVLWISASLLVVVVFLSIDMLRYFVGINSGSGFNYNTLTQFGFVFTLAILFGHLISQYSRALQASEQMNVELVSRIQAATVELEHHLAERHQLELQENTQQERQRIYRDLHDDVGAKLTSILHSADTSKQKQMARAALESLRETVHHANYPGQTMQELLHMVTEEMQIRLQAAGLRFMEENTKLNKDRPLSSKESYHLARVMRELINNILNHAKADEVHLRATVQEGKGFIVTIRDNGRGFQTDSAAGNGLNNIRHRMQELGGQARWVSSIGQGCTVEITLP